MDPTTASETDSAETLQVLYNDQCPVCSFEITHYADYARARDLAIGFEDLNATDIARWGMTRDEAARRLYVRQGDALLSGIPAFIVLWRAMPRYRWLARLVQWPGVFWLANQSYDRVLAPLIYAWHKRRLARDATET